MPWLGSVVPNQGAKLFGLREWEVAPGQQARAAKTLQQLEADYAKNPQGLQLVRDALYARKMRYVGCLAFNKSSEEVEKVGSSILPAIEYVLLEAVMPNCPIDQQLKHATFPGSNNFTVSYFQIAKYGQMERAARFLSSIHGAVLIVAIRAIGIVWDNRIPDPFMPTIEKLACIGTPEEREVALWSLDWHYNKPQKDKEPAGLRMELGISTGKE
jgi:hypothetical protein